MLYDYVREGKNPLDNKNTLTVHSSRKTCKHTKLEKIFDDFKFNPLHIPNSVMQIYDSNKEQLFASHARVSYNEIVTSAYKEHNERLFKLLCRRTYCTYIILKATLLGNHRITQNVLEQSIRYTSYYLLNSNQSHQIAIIKLIFLTKLLQVLVVIHNRILEHRLPARRLCNSCSISLILCINQMIKTSVVRLRNRISTGQNIFFIFVCYFHASSTIKQLHTLLYAIPLDPFSFCRALVT